MTWEEPVPKPTKTPTKRPARRRGSSNGSGPSPTDGDAFLLNENGTVRMRWRDHNILLWTPTVDEYEQLIVEYEATRPWYSEEGRTTQQAYSAGSPNAKLWAKIIEVLGDNEDEVAPGDLPTWALTADALEKIIRHWRVNPLARGESQDMIQQLATEMVAQLTQSAVKPQPTAPASSPEAASPESEES